MKAASSAIGAPAAFLSGGGVAGELARSIDWSRTPLGPPATWPGSLQTMVGVILSSRHPMFLWWGPELIQFYNDAYLPSFGRGKHPAAMGQPGRDCWQEIWPIIWPQIDDVMTRRKPSWNEDALVPIFRNGRIEEVYWTYGYSPVIDEAGAVGGTLVVCTETTARVIASRRASTIRALGEKSTWATDPQLLLRHAAEALGEATADVPFALMYVRDATGADFRLVQSAGLRDPATEELVRARVLPLLLAHDGARERLRTPVAIDPSGLPGGPWPEPASSIYIAPLGRSPGGRPFGFVVFGLSPRLSFDGAYRDHLEQLADQISLGYARIDAFRMRTAAENERNSLLLQAPVATALLTGPHHLFQLANPRYCQMVGRVDVVGKTYLEAFPELAATPLPGILDRVYQTGEPFFTSELLVPLRKQPGDPLEDCFFTFNLEPLRDAGGTVYGMMAVAVEITELVLSRKVLEKAHAEREKLLEDLESAGRAKDEFLAMLGHELRNPLSPIVTALQLMKLRGDATTTREQQVIERQVDHLVRLVDDLLDISKITRGKVELRWETVEIAEVIAKAVEMASMLFEQRSHLLTIEASRQGLLWEGDPVRLAQVVANLLTNAARYTPRGGDIKLSAARAGGEIVIRVRDNGIGIAPEMLPRIFDLFVQGKQSADRAEGGLGIGLTLVKTLVGLHGGSVVATSAGLGAGSEFVIRLPAAPTVAPRSSASGSSTSGLGAPPPFIATAAMSKRVLLVDDNRDAAELLAEALREPGHQVEVANDPVVALEAAARFHPEVAILDIGLPVMDGYELAARLRALPGLASCRLIALTGYGQEHDRARSQSGGFERHLVKPVDLDTLMLVVAESAGSAR
jgi:signal transduction histidine kinase/CheY-like chemotaxis protein